MFNQIPELNFQVKALPGATLSVFAFLACGVALRVVLRYRYRLPLPPGPPGHWIFGNVIPRINQSQQFAAWINQYGPVISLRTGMGTMIIIGRYKESVEIMEKKGSLLADRPRSVAAGEILSRGLRMVLAPANERLRRLRRAAHTHLQAKAAESYEPIQIHAARNVILDILDDPKHHQTHIRRYATVVILRITYGKTTPTDMNSPEMVSIHKMIKRFQTLLLPGTMLVDNYPILKYFPFYTRRIEAWRQEESKVFNGQLNQVSQEMNEGTAGPSFSRYLLENEQTHKLGHEEMVYLAGSLFGAGSDTTAVAIMGIIMAAACHPEAQQRVQDELDVVVGREMPPTFDEYHALPQVEAFILECLRWRPVTPFGFSHRAMTDITYGDYIIPKGAIVLGNHWSISRDPEVYPNPDKFDPQRWLSDDGKIRDDLKFPGFGFGRRICPGQHVASRSVFINTVLLLWSFSITQDPTSPIEDNVDGVIAHPKPFEACFTPRIGDEAHLREVMAKYSEGL